MANFLFRLGRGSAARPFVVIIAWLVALAAAAGSFLAFGGTLTDSFSIPGTETQRVSDQLADEIDGVDGATARVVFETDNGAAFTDEQQTQISEALATAATHDSVGAVVDPFATAAQVEQQMAQLSEGAAQIDAARAQLDAGQEQLDAARAELEAGQAQLDEAVAQAQAAAEAGQGPVLTPEQMQAAAAELAAQQEQLDAGRAEIEAQQAELDAGRAELDAQDQQLTLGQQLADNASGLSTVSEDGSTALGAIPFSVSLLELSMEDKEQVMNLISDSPLDGVNVHFSSELAQQVGGILGVGEIVGVVIALIVLLVMMRTVWPALQPIITSVIGVGVGVAAAMALSGSVEMSSVTPVLGVMLALAVGIDYSLFIVNRHRINLKAGMGVREAAGLANGTAGNAVVFAGSTVIIALLALNVTGIPFIGVMGTVAAFCVLVAVLVGITLTPALLGLIKMRAISKRSRNRIGHPDEAEPPLKPMRTGKAIGALLLGVVVLGVIAIPSASMRLGLPSGESEPADSSQYQAYTTIDERFGEGLNGTLLVTAALPQAVAEEEVMATQVLLGNEFMSHADVAAVAPAGVSTDRDFFAFQVIPVDGPTSESTENLVHDLRDQSPLSSTSDVLTLNDVEIGVAGSASGNIDISQKLDDALPLYLAVVVGLSLIILIVVFRSLLVPLMATLGFVLSLFAAFGAVTAIYQWGWLSSIFDVHAPGPILSFLPILLTGILFGLAMDYQLFLTSGMREAYVHGERAREAVVAGMRQGRAVVTAAAIIMVSVFGGFVFSHLSMIRPMGFGLAVGVLFDAFVVRMVILPSLMHLVGEGAWWLPKWLDRLLPNVDIEGSSLERAHPAPQVTS